LSLSACVALLLGAATVLSVAVAPPVVLAQGVFTPAPGSAPAATGPNAVNPSAAASDRNPSAHNPSAAPSALSSPNAINPSATPSTFAPQSSPLATPTVVPRQFTAPRRIVRPRGSRTRAAQTQERAPARRAVAEAPTARAEAVRRTDQRARAIMGSVCRGC
jgi:hypothetical protein